MSNDKKLIPLDIPLNGKLITSEDPTTIGTNFQSLKNMRYTDTHIKGIAGMTKINTTALTTYLKPKSMIHFQKDQPSIESHLLVQAQNSAETGYAVWDNKAAIPAQGDFEATALLTKIPSTGTNIGRFSNAPGGYIAFCDKSGSYLWGGDEQRIAHFACFDPAGSYYYDSTNEITNTLTNSLNIAKIANASVTIDSYVTLLLHMNGTDGSTTFTDDSPTTPHTVTAVGDAQIDTADKKFGTASGLFDGTGDYLTIPDSDDFDLSGGIWTIDFWFKSNNIATTQVIYSQGNSSTDYVLIYIYGGKLRIEVYETGAPGRYVRMESTALSSSIWYHAEIVENGNNWYIFINGTSVGSHLTNSAPYDRAKNYIGSVYIGSSLTSADGFNGWLDEFRISKGVARHTSSFTPPSSEYSSSSTQSYFYLGSLQPLKNIKFYLDDIVNTVTSTMTISYWGGAGWVEVSSLSDGTAVAGKSLAQTGTVTFTDTESVVKIKIINQIALYWYQIHISSLDTTTEIYQITAGASLQSIKDIWDGDLRTVLSCFVYDNSTFNDNTINVNQSTYDSNNTATYANISSLGTTEYIIVGFPEKQMGVSVNLISGSVNTVSTTINVYYWDGLAWTTVGEISDGTSEGGKTFGKSGIISWQQIASNLEFKREIQKESPLYYYKISFDVALSSNVKIFYIAGIPSQNTMGNYAFPIQANNRLMLCSDQSSNKNSVLISAKDTSVVFNGNDSIELLIGGGKELTCGTAMFVQFGSSLYNMILFFKKSEFWVMIGNGPEDWILYQVHTTIGCPAPATLKVIDVITENFIGKIAIWQGSDGIYMFDGKTVSSIHKDIKNLFDRQTSDNINFSKIYISSAEYNNIDSEYHWFFASGDSTSCNREFVYSFKKQAWYEVSRETGNYIQIATIVNDSMGNPYLYGCTNSGYIERLNNGTTFDGTVITHLFHLGDINFTGDNYESEIRRIKLIGTAKTITTNSISVTRYGNGITTAPTLDTITMSPINSGYRIYQNNQGFRSPYTYHSLKFQMITSDETIGFEPLKVGLFIHHIREDY